MNPGRELDALIAEKVMGWKNAGSQRWVDPKLPGQDVKEEMIPEYSTDIAAAWEVISKTGDQYIIEGQDGIGWYVSIIEASMREDRYENPFKAMASTAPHAICLAALEVVSNREKIQQEYEERRYKGIKVTDASSYPIHPLDPPET